MIFAWTKGGGSHSDFSIHRSFRYPNRIFLLPASCYPTQLSIENPYSPQRLFVDRMEKLIVELLLVEYLWCQKQSWFYMHLLCNGMIGFGLWQNLGKTEKEHPSPLFPVWRSSSLKVKRTVCLQSSRIFNCLRTFVVN